MSQSKKKETQINQENDAIKSSKNKNSITIDESLSKEENQPEQEQDDKKNKKRGTYSSELKKQKTQIKSKNQLQQINVIVETEKSSEKQIKDTSQKNSFPQSGIPSLRQAQVDIKNYQDQIKAERIKNLQQFDVDWIDIQNLINDSFTQLIIPHQDSLKEFYQILIFQQNMVKKQSNVLQNLQEAVFKQKQIDFEELYRDWELQKTKNLDNQKLIESTEESMSQQSLQHQSSLSIENKGDEIIENKELLTPEQQQIENEDQEISFDQTSLVQDKVVPISLKLRKQLSTLNDNDPLKKILNKQIKKTQKNIENLDSQHQIEIKIDSKDKEQQDDIIIQNQQNVIENTQSYQKLLAKENKKNSKLKIKKFTFDGDYDYEKQGLKLKNKKNIFNDFFDQIQEIKNQVLQFQFKMSESNDLANLKIENLNEDYQDLKTALKKLEETQKEDKKEMKNLEILEMEFQNQIEQMIEQLMKHNLNQIKLVNKDVNKIEIELSQTNSSVHNNETKIQGLQERHKDMRQSQEYLEKRILEIELYKMNAQHADEMEQLNKEIIKRIQIDLDGKENKIKTLERFIDLFVPIRIQSQLSETLGAVLSRPFLNKLEAFEQEKYKQLNELVLKVDQHHSLDESIKNLGIQLVDYTQKFSIISKKNQSGIFTNQQKSISDNSKENISYLKINESGNESSSITFDKLIKQNQVRNQENNNINDEKNEQSKRQINQKQISIELHPPSSASINKTNDFKDLQSNQKQIENLEIITDELFNQVLQLSNRSMKSQKLHLQKDNSMIKIIQDNKQLQPQNEVMRYLLEQDFSENLNLIELANLDFDLTELEDAAFLNKNQTTNLKLTKVLLYYMGLIDKKQSYNFENLEKKMENYQKEQIETIRILFDQLKDSVSNYHFEIQQQEQNLEIQSRKINSVQEEYKNFIIEFRNFIQNDNKNLQVDQLAFINEFQRIQNFINVQLFSLFERYQQQVNGIDNSKTQQEIKKINTNNNKSVFFRQKQEFESDETQNQVQTSKNMSPKIADQIKRKNGVVPISFQNLKPSEEQSSFSQNLNNYNLQSIFKQELQNKNLQMNKTIRPNFDIQEQINNENYKMKLQNKKTIETDKFQLKNIIEQQSNENMNQTSNSQKASQGNFNQHNTSKDTSTRVFNEEYISNKDAYQIESNIRNKIDIIFDKAYKINEKQSTNFQNQILNVQYRNRFLPLQYLIEMQLLINEKIEQIIKIQNNEKERQPLKNLNGQKIFQDLYDYYFLRKKKIEDIQQKQNKQNQFQDSPIQLPYNDQYKEKAQNKKLVLSHSQIFQQNQKELEENIYFAQNKKRGTINQMQSRNTGQQLNKNQTFEMQNLPLPQQNKKALNVSQSIKASMGSQLQKKNIPILNSQQKQVSRFLKVDKGTGDFSTGELTDKVGSIQDAKATYSSVNQISLFPVLKQKQITLQIAPQQLYQSLDDSQKNDKRISLLKNIKINQM